MDLLDMIALDVIREGEGKRGRRPGLKVIAHAIGLAEATVAKRLKAMEAAAVIAPRKPKPRGPKPDSARYLAAQRRRAAVKARQAAAQSISR